MWGGGVGGVRGAGEGCFSQGRGQHTQNKLPEEKTKKKNTQKKEISDFGPFSYGYGEGENI